MKKIILILLILAAYSFSAVFDVTLFKKNKMDLAGRRNPVNDTTGNPCALIRVRSDLEDLKFEGEDIVKMGIESSGKYYIYISQMSKGIRLLGKNLEPIDFEFPIPLESTIVFDLELSKNDGLTSSEPIEKLIKSDDPEIMGNISNLQVAPFDNNIISFEIRSAEDLGEESDKTVKLFLYNVLTKALLRIESSKIETKTSEGNKYYYKDRSLSWHPTENWFVFNGNGFKNRENIYICKINDLELMSMSSLESYMIDLYDQRYERSYCRFPTFDSTGKDLYFSRQLSKKSKKAKYNKSFSLAMISNIFENVEQKFKNINFNLLSEEKYDQFRVKCSPTDPNLVAYISFQHKIRSTSKAYMKYWLNIYDKRSKSVVTVDKLDGFRDYSFQWSSDGKYIFYNKAASLDDTDKQFIKDKINKINLYFARITYEGGKLVAKIQKNLISDVLLEDVTGKDDGIAFINDNKVIVSKYDPYNSLGILNLQQWMDGREIFYEKLDLLNDTDEPALANDRLYYIEYEYIEVDKMTIVSINSVKTVK